MAVVHSIREAAAHGRPRVRRVANVPNGIAIDPQTSITCRSQLPRPPRALSQDPFEADSSCQVALHLVALRRSTMCDPCERGSPLDFGLLVGHALACQASGARPQRGQQVSLASPRCAFGQEAEETPLFRGGRLAGFQAASEQASRRSRGSFLRLVTRRHAAAKPKKNGSGRAPLA